MNYALYRSVGTKESLSEQEGAVCDYASSVKMRIDSLFTEFSALGKELDSRPEIKSFMQNLKEDDVVMIYDLWVLSSKADELVKMFTCLFKKNIDIHITSKRVVVNKDSSSYLILGMMNDVREESIAEKSNRTNGRPKGSISKSKFDELKNEIILLLQDNINVSEISRRLKVNRSSLKDYINSRGLKDLILRQQEGSKFEFDEQSGTVKILESIECPFKKEQKNLKARSVG